MKKFTRMVCMLMALCMMLSVASCGSSSSTDTAESSSAESSTAESATTGSGGSDSTEGATATKSYLDTVTVGEYSEAAFVNPTFDPTGLTGSISNNGSNYMIYDVLFHVTADGSYESRVVESYEWTDDTHLVINIKDGIYFSNGDQLLADDILYSLELRAQSSMRASYYQVFLTDESTVSDDGLSLTLVTETACSTYMFGLDFAILDKDYVESVGFDNIDWSDETQIVGSGPYTVSYYVADSEIRYEKRDDYWGLAYGYDDTVKEYVVYNYTDRSTMSIDFENGVLDLAIDLAETDYARLLSNDSTEYTPALIHGNDIFVIAMDAVNSTYLSDPAVREAVCLAADVDAITAAINGSYGGVATGSFAETELGYASGYTYTRDVEKAKEILADAGYSDGEIKLNFLVYGVYEAPATVLQSNLAEIGIDMTVQSVDIASYWSNIGGAGNSDFMAYQTSNPACDPATHLSYWKSTSAFSVMRRDYDDLVVAAEATLDVTERATLYQELQARWYENYDLIPVCEYLVSFAYRNDVFNSLELASTNSPWLLDADYVTD